MKTLTKTQVDTNFKNWVLPAVVNQYEKDGLKDIPARQQAYNDYIDMLQKDGQISESQANRYCIPKNLI